MSSSQALTLGMTALVIIACSGCVGSGGNAQTFDTNFGQIQIKTPETLEPTFGSVNGLGILSGLSVLSLGKKGSGMPLLIITLTENNELSNFQNSVSAAQMMMQNGRFLTTNDNHKMYWASTQLGNFKLYEGFIDYGNDKGLFVDIKGLSETVDPSTGKSFPGLSESESLDIFKSFTFVGNSGSTDKTSVSNTPSSVPVSAKQENIVLGPYTVSFDLGNAGAYSINVKQPEEEVNGTSYDAEIEGSAPSSFSIRMGIVEGHEKKPVSGLEEKLREGFASKPVGCEKSTIVARTIDGKPGTLGSMTCSDGLVDVFAYPLDYIPEDNTLTSIFTFFSIFPGDEGTYRDEVISSLLKTIHVEKRGSSNAPSEIAEAIDTTPISGRTLDWITIKRNEIDPSGKDKYGHYWIEILDGPDGKPVESYGWWPKYPLSPDLTGAVNTLGGVQGELNGITSFKGTSTTDPDQGTTAKREFHPKLMNTLTDQQVLDKIHDFVRSYKGEWRWTFGWGQNCQTFQTALMKNVGLADPDSEDISRTDSSPSTTQKTTNTKTAYTHDGISYISKERVDENIKAGVANPGDYEEVQVPLDTFVVGGSTIPG
jgi:hypothetical protein